MSVRGSDTHADTIRAVIARLADNYSVSMSDARLLIEAIDALIAEVEQERARADRAEGALREIEQYALGEADMDIVNFVRAALDCDCFACHTSRIARAALSAGSGGREAT